MEQGTAAPERESGREWLGRVRHVGGGAPGGVRGVRREYVGRVRRSGKDFCGLGDGARQGEGKSDFAFGLQVAERKLGPFEVSDGNAGLYWYDAELQKRNPNFIGIRAYLNLREIEHLGKMLRDGRTFEEWKSMVDWRRTEDYDESLDELGPMRW